MGEKNAHSRGGLIIPWKPLFLFFFLTSALFVLSWFFVLRSTGRPRFVYHNLLPNSRLFVTNDEHFSQQPPPAENNADGEQEEGEEERPKDDSTLTLVGLDSKKGNLKNATLRVYMYDLPPEFHFQLLEWKPEADAVWPNIRTRIPGYPGGLNLQHSIAYWLTLDLLNSEFDHSSPNRAAVRIRNSSEADIIFVPFFSSLSYNRYSKVKRKDRKDIDKDLQGKLVTYLTSQELWKKSGGRDHVIVAHHPNSMLFARMKLWPATFILSDFGRYPPNIANVEKDVIAPYKHVIRNFYNDTSTFDSRKTLLYFQGAIYRKDGGYARQELFYLLKDEKDVHFSFGSVQKDGVRKASEGMHNSKFCLNIAGDTPSSNRLFDAIASHCVPVIISDDIELPYEDAIDYTEFCLFVRTIDAVKKGFLIKLVRSISREEWTKMWHKLKEVEKFFEFNYPSRQGDAVQMIWQAVARKVPAIRFKMHRSNRYYRSGGHRERGLRSVPVPSNFW